MTTEVNDFKKRLSEIDAKFHKADRKAKSKATYNSFRGQMKVCNKPYRFCAAQFVHTQTANCIDKNKELRLLCTSDLKFCLLDTRQRLARSAL